MTNIFKYSIKSILDKLLSCDNVTSLNDVTSDVHELIYEKKLDASSEELDFIDWIYDTSPIIDYTEPSNLKYLNYIEENLEGDRDLYFPIFYLLLSSLKIVAYKQQINSSTISDRSKTISKLAINNIVRSLKEFYYTSLKKYYTENSYDFCDTYLRPEFKTWEENVGGEIMYYYSGINGDLHILTSESDRAADIEEQIKNYPLVDFFDQSMGNDINDYCKDLYKAFYVEL